MSECEDWCDFAPINDCPIIDLPKQNNIHILQQILRKIGSKNRGHNNDC